MVQAGRLRPQGGPRLLRLLRATRTARTIPSPPRPAARPASSWSRARDVSPRTCATPAAEAGYEVLDIEQINGDAPDILIDAVTGRSPLEAEPTIDDPETLVLALCVDGSLAELDTRRRSGRLSRAAPAGRVAAGRDDALVGDARARRAAGRGVLPLARQARRMGGRRAGPGAGADRLPARQRGGFAVSEGVGSPDGRRHRDARGLQLPARAARVGGRDRARPRPVDARRAVRGAEGGALPGGAAAAPDGRRGRDRRGDRDGASSSTRRPRPSPANGGAARQSASPSEALHAGALRDVAVRHGLVAAAVRDTRPRPRCRGRRCARRCCSRS